MNHAAARAEVDALFTGKARRLPKLRAHLDGCPECRAHYDQTARAFRALSGRPEEMTPEELALFAPVFPGEAPARARWPMVWIGGLAAAAAALVVFVQAGPAAEFSPRGGTAAVAEPGLRALCSRGRGAELVVVEPGDSDCLEGDRLSFVAAAPGGKFVAVVLVAPGDKLELVVSGGEGALPADGREVVLPYSSRWAPALRAVAIFGREPIAPALAQRCAVNECPSPLERREILLGGAPR